MLATSFDLYGDEHARRVGRSVQDETIGGAVLVRRLRVPSLVLAVGVACSAVPWADDEPRPVAREHEGVTALVWDRPGAPDRPAMTAILEGSVTTGASGCVLLRLEDGDTTAVVWPAGTEVVSASPVTLGFGDGTEVSEGDRVSSGGGHVPADMLFGEGGDAPCVGNGGSVAAINPRDTVRPE